MNVVKEELLPAEETDDSCVFKYIEIVPLDTDTFNLSQQKQFLHILINVCFFINFHFSVAAVVANY